jgi:hypothetical protein
LDDAISMLSDLPIFLLPICLVSSLELDDFYLFWEELIEVMVV